MRGKVHFSVKKKVVLKKKMMTKFYGQDSDALYYMTQHAEETLEEYHKIIKKIKETGEKFKDDEKFDKPVKEEPEITLKRLEDHYGNDIFKCKKSEYGVVQQELGDCFLISVLCKVGQFPDLVKSLFVDSNIESGCACIRFQHMERPIYIIVDTLVPFKYVLWSMLVLDLDFILQTEMITYHLHMPSIMAIRFIYYQMIKLSILCILLAAQYSKNLFLSIQSATILLF